METPSISATRYASNVFNLTAGASGFAAEGIPASVQWDPGAGQDTAKALNLIIPTMANPSRRIVQVFIADPNENVPLDQSVLYKGDQKLTDLTDNELFFEVPISETLARHNEKRVKWPDKEASKRAGKDVLLDPAKIRDLKMVVVTVASF